MMLMLFTDLKSSSQVMIYRRFKMQAFYTHAGYPKTFCAQCIFIKAWANATNSLSWPFRKC